VTVKHQRCAFDVSGAARVRRVGSPLAPPAPAARAGEEASVDRPPATDDRVPASPAAGLDLRHVHVLITGASGGLGLGIVHRFLAAGARVVAHHRSASGEQRLRELADRVADAGNGGRGDVIPVAADLATVEGPDALVRDAVAQVGRLDVLVNNAGVQPLAPLAEVDAAAWDELFAVDLRAVHLCTRAFAAHRRTIGGGGAVVHVASIEGLQPAPNHGHYATAKAGVRAHARAAAAEFGPEGLRVNVVSPGLIDRAGLERDWPDGVARWRARAPLRRLGQPEDVGDACVVLASPLTRWVTGAELIVDGGVLSRPTW
jgi:NAD(P)-dependent dehydrogenase (short-subunit alcohol dehydrogenase family)